MQCMLCTADVSLSVLATVQYSMASGASATHMDLIKSMRQCASDPVTTYSWRPGMAFTILQFLIALTVKKTVADKLLTSGLRTQEHFNGKQFVGWSKIRAKLKDLEEKFRGSGARERTERDGDRDRDRNWQRATSRDREREGRGASRGHDDYRGGDSRGYGGGERERDRRGDRYGERGYGGGGERYGDRGYRGERGYEDRRGGYGGSRERERGSDRYGERGGYGDRGGYGSSGRREYRR